MNFLDRFKFAFSSKESQSRIVTSYFQTGRPVSTPTNYSGFARQGYSRNIVVYAAISKIATACAGINWVLYEKKSGRKRNWVEIENHPLLDLINKPNPLDSGSDFINAVVGFYKITGNSYIEMNKPNPNKPPVELWTARPDQMRIVPASNGYPDYYSLKYAGQERRWYVDPIKLTSDMIHIKSFNPNDIWYGMSALEAAMLSIDQNNAGQKWNLALLQKSATPSGVLQMKSTDANPNGNLTNEQYERLKKEFEENHGGSNNAGKPMILEGGLSWQSISLGPKDMDFVNNKNVTATDIAIALGVPPEIMGLGTKTFNNYKEARLAFYDETVCPTMDVLRNNFNNHLTTLYGDNLYLDYDKDDIEAYVEKREAKYSSLETVSYLTQNEKREAVGYDRKDGLDVYKVGNLLVSEDDLTNQDTEEGEDDEMDDDSDDSDSSNNNSSNNDSTESIDNDQDLEDEDDEKSDLMFKSFNLLNANERRKSWKKQNRLRGVLEKSFERDVKDDFKKLTKQMSDVAEEIGVTDEQMLEYALSKVVGDWTPDLEKTMTRHITNTLETFGENIFSEGKSIGLNIETKANVRFQSFIDEFVKLRTATQITTIVNTSQKTVKRVISDFVNTSIRDGESLPTISKFLEERFGELSESSARRIARTEVGTASSNATLAAAKSIQAPSMVKEWVSANDSRVRSEGNADHSTVNAENGQIPIDDKFIVFPDTPMDGPGDMGAPPEQVINCRCVLTFKSKNQGEV